MIIASQTWTLTIPGCSSLKEKRSVVRSLKDRLRRRFNVSVAETGLQDVHDRAELSLVLVTNDRRFADGVLDKADDLVADNGRALISDLRRDVH